MNSLAKVIVDLWKLLYKLATEAPIPFILFVLILFTYYFLRYKLLIRIKDSIKNFKIIVPAVKKSNIYIYYAVISNRFMDYLKRRLEKTNTTGNTLIYIYSLVEFALVCLLVMLLLSLIFPSVATIIK
jgi:hypothetical protein